MVAKGHLAILGFVLTVALAACGGAAPATSPPQAAATTAPTDTPALPTDTPAPPPADTPAPTPTPGPPTPTPIPDTGETIGPGWQVTTIDVGIKPAVALDGKGRPHVAYMVEAEHGYVNYAHLGEDGWSRSTAAEGYYYGPPAIAVGPDDVPHIVWHDHQDPSEFKPDKGDATRAVLRDGKWFVGAIASEGHDGWDNSIVVDSQGTVHTASIDPSQFESQDGVEYAVFDDGWQVEAIGSGPIAYEFGTAIDVDGQDRPGITYYDDVAGTLQYARRGADGGWTVETVDGDGNVGKFSSLAYDAEGRPHISYFADEGDDSGAVRYAFWDGSAWQIEAVEQLTGVEQGRVGARHLTWLRLDSQGRPHLAYNDRRQLKYAVRTGAGWEIELVAEAGDVPFGQLVVMDLDDQDRPHLVYSVFTSLLIPEGVVKYAVRQP